MNRQEQLELILDHFECPRFRGRLDGAPIVMQGRNPACGDRVSVFVELDASQQYVARMTWEGEGCTISQASASLTAELVQGKRVEEVLRLDSRDLAAYFGDDVVSARLRCVMLPLYTLRVALRTSLNETLAAKEAEWAQFHQDLE
nr:iron-sulfur cluster assembly scaffold protein [Ardenticatena sp.]